MGSTTIWMMIIPKSITISNFSSHFQTSIVFLSTGHKALNIIQVLQSEHVKIWIYCVCIHTLIYHSTCVFHLSKWQRNRYLWKVENWYMVSSWTLYLPFPFSKWSLHSMNSDFWVSFEICPIFAIPMDNPLYKCIIIYHKNSKLIYLNAMPASHQISFIYKFIFLTRLSALIWHKWSSLYLNFRTWHSRYSDHVS